MALAIELAAARVATLGLDGLGRGLADPLGLLTGGSGWTSGTGRFAPCSTGASACSRPTSRRPYRRASVFASPFTAAAAADVAGFAPLTTTAVSHALASLAEHNLVVVVDGPSGTRYRMLEPIRQYGAELMDRDGEQDDVRARHLRWCLADSDTAAPLAPPPRGSTKWPTTLRAALRWSAGRQAWHAEAHQLAVRLAGAHLRAGKAE